MSRVIELEAGAARATIDPRRGGRLASLRLGDQELLVGPPDEEDASIGWGCYLMAPWPGRLAHGRFQWRGRTVQLRRTHGRHAIHGLVWAAPWTVDRRGRTEAALSIDLEGRDGWPFGGQVGQVFRLTDRALAIEASITASEDMPAALGWHPWFRRSGDPRLRVAADATLQTREMLPTDELEPVRGRTDLRNGPRLGRRRLDHAFVDAASPAVVRWADLELQLHFRPTPATVVVFTPPHALCVEPQTVWPNAFNLGPDDTRGAGQPILEAGETLRARVELHWAHPGGDPEGGAG